MPWSRPPDHIGLSPPLRMKGPNKPLGDVVEGLPRPTIDIVAFPGDQKLDPPSSLPPRDDLLDVLALWSNGRFRPRPRTCGGFGWIP